MLDTKLYPLEAVSQALEAMLYITVRGDSWKPDGSMTKTDEEIRKVAQKNVQMLLTQAGILKKRNSKLEDEDEDEDAEEDDAEEDDGDDEEEEEEVASVEEPSEDDTPKPKSVEVSLSDDEAEDGLLSQNEDEDVDSEESSEEDADY